MLACAAALAAACASSQPPGDDEVDAAVSSDALAAAPDSGTAGCPLNDPDSDSDGVCDSVDACPGADDTVDADSDGVADGCDDCPGADDALDADSDGVPDGCDICAGADDTADADADGVPNDCDACPGFDDSIDPDLDGVPDGCDQCAGFDDTIDVNVNGIPDGCDCDDATEVRNNGICYYLDGSAGACDAGYTMAPQSILTTIAAMFVGKTYKHAVSDNCCVMHANQAAELQDWGMSAQCNSAGPFTIGPVPGGAGCTDANQMYSLQLTLCQSSP